MLLRMALGFCSILYRPCALLHTDPEYFLLQLKNIIKEAGLEYMQEVSDNTLHPDNERLKQKVSEVSDYLSSTISKSAEMLEKTRKVLQDEYVKFALRQVYDTCCNTDNKNMKRHEGHSYEVDMNTMCHQLPTWKKGEWIGGNEDVTYPSDSVRKEFRKNYDLDKNVLWQYFGAKTGLLTVFPSFRPRSFECPLIDHRFKSWYVNTATRRKNIIFIIDTHVSSHKQLAVMKSIAKILVETVRSCDMIAVFANSPEEIIWPVGVGVCFLNTLVPATRRHTNQLISFIDQLRGHFKSSYYSTAIELALESLHDMEKTRLNKFSTIVFITGSSTVEDTQDVLDVISDATMQFNIRATFITLNIGGHIDISEKLKAIAGPNGLYVYIELSSPTRMHLYEQLAPFYTFLASDSGQPPVFSLVRLSHVNVDSMLTMSLPVFHNEMFIGVIGLDLSVRHLWTEFNIGIYTYFFIVDQDYHLLYHPLLPIVVEAGEEPVSLDVGLVETEADKRGVIASMKRGESGIDRFPSTRVLTYGNAYSDGVETHMVPSIYRWRQIKHTTLAICDVIGDGYHEVDFDLSTAGSTPVHYIYHNITENDKVKKCRLYERVATIDGSAVKFPLAAFKQPLHYLDNPEDQATIRRYDDAITKTTDNRMFQDRTVKGVHLTSIMDVFWKKQKDAASNYAIWRYIVIADGHIRIFPGIELNKRFVPKLTNWYLTATGLPRHNMTAVTAPRLDDNGAGYTVTISQTLLIPRDLSSPLTFPGLISSTISSAGNESKRSHHDIAVLAIDVSIEFFYEITIGLYPPCQQTNRRCVLLNKAGYVVSYHGMMQTPMKTTDIPQIKNVHLTYLEGHIANDLITRGYMTKTRCLELTQQTVYVTYELPFDLKVDETDVPYSRVRYKMDNIPSTNLFLLYIETKITYMNIKREPCICTRWMSPNLPQCHKKPLTKCECPCYKIPDENVCATDVLRQVCTPRKQHHDNMALAEREEVEIEMLADCYDRKQCSYSTPRECHGYSGCRWCTVDRTGIPLSSPYCELAKMCYFGMLGHPGPYPSRDTSSSPDRSLLRADVIIYFTFVFILIATVAFANARTSLSTRIVAMVHASDSEFELNESVYGQFGKHSSEASMRILHLQQKPTTPFGHQPKRRQSNLNISPHRLRLSSEPQPKLDDKLPMWHGMLLSQRLSAKLGEQHSQRVNSQPTHSRGKTVPSIVRRQSRINRAQHDLEIGRNLEANVRETESSIRSIESTRRRGPDDQLRRSSDVED